MFRKINESTARKMFAEGKVFYMVPCKMRPSRDYHIGFNITCVVDDFTRACGHSNFNALVNEYSYYNCTTETGRSLAYYVWED